jgi:hypothetical protein
LEETIWRGMQRRLLQDNATRLCPDCLHYPLVGDWYQPKIVSSSTTTTAIPYQESEMEAWMLRHFGNDDSDDAKTLTTPTTRTTSFNCIKAGTACKIASNCGVYWPFTCTEVSFKVLHQSDRRTIVMLIRPFVVIETLHWFCKMRIILAFLNHHHHRQRALRCANSHGSKPLPRRIRVITIWNVSFNS